MNQLIADRYMPTGPAHAAGAPGSAFAARDTMRGADVTLRVVADADHAGEHWVLQLRAGALARLRHPHLGEILDSGHLGDGGLFVAESPRRGRPVLDVLPLPPNEVPGIFLGLCQALRALHRRGFAHGELGAAHVGLAEGFTPTLAHGARLGVGARLEDDMAALGPLFFHLLTGRLPQPGETLPSQAASNVPAHQDALVHRLLTGGCETVDDVISLLPFEADEAVALPLGHGPLVGRDDALSVLAGAWSAATAERRGCLVAVAGEAGVGKSRLLEEATLGWRLAGAPVLVGRAAADAAPYRPWVEVLRQLLPIARQRCPEALASAAPALAVLVDGLGAAPAPSLEPRQEKLRLQGALADLLGAVSAGGLLIVLEDWGSADVLSRETLAFVVRACADKPLLVAVAGSLGDGGPAPERTLELAPLTPDALGQFATDLLGGRPLAPEALGAVLDAAGGNPQLTRQLLGHLAGAGQLRLSASGWAIAGDLRDRPCALEDLQRERLRSLGPVPLEAARLAAVVGAEGELAMLGAIWPHGATALTTALDSLVAAGVLQTSGAYFRFEPPTWAGLLEADAEESFWRAAHDRAARALAERHAAGSTHPDWVLRHATHALAGTDPARAVEAALAAGRFQLAFNDPGAARRFLERGLALWEQAGGADGPQAGLELEYRRLLGDVLRIGGEYAAAVGMYQRACELAEGQGERPLLGYMLTSAGKAMQMSNKYAEAEAFYQSSLAAYEGLGDAAGRLRALNSLARVQMVVGQRQKAEKLYLQAMAEAEASDQAIALGEALGALGLNLVSNDPSRIQEGIGYLERSVGLRKDLGDKIGLNDAYSLLGNAYLTLGRFPQAKDAFVRNQRLCFECGLADDEIFAFINLAIVALEMGEFSRGRALAVAAKERSIASGSRFCLSLALALEALAGAYLAELIGVTAAMDEAVAIARELKNKYLEINVLVWQAEALLIFGRLTDAVEVAQAATALMEELGYREFEPRLLVFQAEVHGRLAERDEARELLARAHDLARDNQNAGMTARVLKTLSWLSLQEKHLLQARDHARQALEVAEGVGAAYLAGEAHWLIGEVDLAAGQHEQATRELLKALDAGEATASPHLQCLALFCLARAADDEYRTREYLFQARDMLREQLGQLDDTDREDYLALAERWRVDRGELVFAEKARAQKGESELGPEGRHYFERMQLFGRFAASLHGLALGQALETLNELLEAQRVCVLIDGAEGRRLVHHVRGGEATAHAAADRVVLEALWGGREVFYQPFVAEDPRFAGLYPGQPATLLAAPFGHGVVMAVRQGATFSSQEAITMGLVGEQFGVAVLNADRLGVPF
jgi:tetratricopeptide (TPR) repeat protein